MNAVAAAGGLGVILPLASTRGEITRLLPLFDGFLFTGGPDVHPKFFSEETLRECGGICTRRDVMELALLRELVQKDIPVLGICRGAQVLNIGLGGDIYQDIDSQFSRSPALQHRQPENSFTPVHTVSIRAGSLLHRILKKEKIMVNSLHHQAVRRPGRGIKICGRALDGVAEALELPGKRFFLGVQWHPEIMWERQEDAAAVFKAFVHACAARSQ